SPSTCSRPNAVTASAGVPPSRKTRAQIWRATPMAECHCSGLMLLRIMTCLTSRRGSLPDHQGGKHVRRLASLRETVQCDAFGRLQSCASRACQLMGGGGRPQFRPQFSTGGGVGSALMSFVSRQREGLAFLAQLSQQRSDYLVQWKPRALGLTNCVHTRNASRDSMNLQTQNSCCRTQTLRRRQSTYCRRETIHCRRRLTGTRGTFSTACGTLLSRNSLERAD